MQTLTSIRRRTCSGRIATLPLSFLPPTKGEVNAFARVRLSVCMSVTKNKSKMSYALQLGILLRRENSTYRYWAPVMQRRVVLKWFYSPRAVHGNNFVAGTCAPPRAVHGNNFVAGTCAPPRAMHGNNFVAGTCAPPRAMHGNNFVAGTCAPPSAF